MNFGVQYFQAGNLPFPDTGLIAEFYTDTVQTVQQLKATSTGKRKCLAITFFTVRRRVKHFN